ncbi:hypothetical protein V6N13_057447 [Hibiscus sabdariffa]|uniref:Uncharacterized protein n=1 Tax=Hibiscus sabdariffa TaxID=183260 RepID=A0ABR2CVC2_9ROSI
MLTGQLLESDLGCYPKGFAPIRFYRAPWIASDPLSQAHLSLMHSAQSCILGHACEPSFGSVFGRLFKSGRLGTISLAVWATSLLWTWDTRSAVWTDLLWAVATSLRTCLIIIANLGDSLYLFYLWTTPYWATDGFWSTPSAWSPPQVTSSCLLLLLGCLQPPAPCTFLLATPMLHVPIGT